MDLHTIDAVVFDIDGTLSESKTDISSDMAAALSELLSIKKVGIISGGRLEQMEKQVVNKIPSKEYFSNLILMPTGGAAMYEWSDISKTWKETYAHPLEENEREEIMKTLKGILKEFKLDRLPLYGTRIEDRGTGITYSALGQRATLDEKTGFDPDGSKRRLVVSALEKKLPQFTATIGGLTSIDVTKKGIDKAFGVTEFSKKSAYRSKESPMSATPCSLTATISPLLEQLFRSILSKNRPIRSI